jgi:hypothetical protein
MNENTNMYMTGKGNWNNFQLDISYVLEVMRSFSSDFQGIEKPWLVWNVDPEWCLVQQKLVELAGWTAIVGGDPRAKKPILLPKSVYIDFNRDLNLPMMHPLFPVEFSWLFTHKIAFWHSDLLIRPKLMKEYARNFELLKDGDMAVTIPKRSIIMKLQNKYDRYWELLACTTRKASENQFENGSGWFSNIIYHPKADPDDLKNRSSVYWDHGAGIKYWHLNFASKDTNFLKIPESKIEEGHCTRIRNSKYTPRSPNNAKRDLSKDLIHNYSLEEECKRLELNNLFVETQEIISEHSVEV